MFDTSVLMPIFSGLAFLLAVYTTLRDRKRSILSKEKEEHDEEQKFAERISRIEFMVAELWDYEMHRGRSEALVKNTMEKNSPIKVSKKARALYDNAGLTTELQEFYAEFGKDLSDQDLFIEISRKFSEKFEDTICRPLGAFNGACVYMAMKIAKEAMVEA